MHANFPWFKAYEQQCDRHRQVVRRERVVFYGIIDDVRIYNRTLSDTEIAALYNAASRPGSYGVIGLLQAPVVRCFAVDSAGR